MARGRGILFTFEVSDYYTEGALIMCVSGSRGLGSEDFGFVTWAQASLAMGTRKGEHDT